MSNTGACLVCVRVQAPQRLVRTDHRSNTIDKYFYLDSQRTQLSQSQSPEKETQRHESSQEESDVEIPSLSDDENDRRGVEVPTVSKKRKRTVADASHGSNSALLWV